MTKEKAVVEQVYRRSKDESVPVLLRFQNGDLTTCRKDSTIYFPVNSSKEKANRAVVITGGNVYSGPFGENLSNELTDTYVCVRNTDTNKVRVIPIDQVKLINHVYKEKESSKFAELNKEDSYAIFARKFGGRRDQRVLNNKLRNEVNLNVVKDQLENTVEESSVLDTTDPVVSADDYVERIRPVFNKDAKHLEKIFNLYDVIPQELIERLDEEASVLYSTEIDKIPISSEFLKTAIKTLKIGPETTEKLLHLKIIVYMDALQTLIKSKGKMLRRLELSKITEKVENDIRERFSDENLKIKIRTSFSNEKAVCYYLVLAFMISEKYELDIKTLAQELCMPKTKIVRFGHLVNATTKSRSTILALQLPSNIKPLSVAHVGRRKNKTL